MTPKIIQRIKGMIQNVAKYCNHGKSPDNKIERFQIFTKKFKKAYDKIEKIENSKFRNVTLDENTLQVMSGGVKNGPVEVARDEWYREDMAPGIMFKYFLCLIYFIT